MSTSLNVTVSRSFDEVAHYRDQWDRLARLQHWPMAEFSWLRSCAAYVSPESSLLILTVHGNTGLAAVLALSRDRGFARPLMTIGSTTTFEAMPLLSDSAAAADCLLERLFDLRQPVVLSRILEPERWQDPIRRAMRGRGTMFMIDGRGAPHLTLPPSTQGLVASLSANRRGSLNRKRRKLDSMGGIRFDSTYPDEKGVLNALADFERLEEAGWKGRRGSAITHRRGFHSFFADVLTTMARERRVRIDQLTLDTTTIAIQLGLVSGGSYFLIKPTYDESLRTLSPGSQLTFEAIKHSIDEGLTSYEFLGAEDEWKLRWTSQIRATQTWVYYPHSARGLVRLGIDSVGIAARRLRARI